MSDDPIGRAVVLRAVAVHAVAVALVFLFVNLFSVWRQLGETLGITVRDALPWIAVCLMAAAAIALLSIRRWRMRVSWPWLAASVVACAAGLAIADPDFPAKRIHVPEYFLLACVVWMSVPGRLRTSATPFVLLACAALYGVHDEFLQGLSPNRTYGLRDMLVNLCGAAGGTFGLLAFAQPAPVGRGRAGAGPVLAVCSVLGGAALFAWAATGYRNDILPYWALLPLLAGTVWVCLAAGQFESPADRLSARALAAFGIAFLIYPVLTHVTLLDFA